MRADSSRSELVIVSPGLVSDTKVSVMLGNQGWYHTILVPYFAGSIHMPYPPKSEEFQNPIWVGSGGQYRPIDWAKLPLA